MSPLSRAAREHEMILIVGAPLRVVDQLHIAALVISPTGAVDAYTKQHMGAFTQIVGSGETLPPEEATVFSPGMSDPDLVIDGQRTAVAICADANRAAHAARAAERGARWYLVSSFVIPAEFKQASTNLQGHAGRHRMLVVFANHGGSTGGLAAAGRSTIWSEAGALLGSLVVMALPLI